MAYITLLYVAINSGDNFLPYSALSSFTICLFSPPLYHYFDYSETYLKLQQIVVAVVVDDDDVVVGVIIIIIIIIVTNVVFVIIIVVVFIIIIILIILISRL